jgi:hypothetical protein
MAVRRSGLTVPWIFSSELFGTHHYEAGYYDSVRELVLHLEKINTNRSRIPKHIYCDFPSGQLYLAFFVW